MQKSIGNGSLWHARMVERHGCEVADRIFYEFSRVEGSYEYVDTWRDCNAYNRKDLARYMRIRRNACCGFAEFQIIHKGNVYWVGFNYGH